MSFTRRHFLRSAAFCSSLGLPRLLSAETKPELSQKLDRILAGRLLHLDALKTPVTIKSMELLRNAGEYLVRVRSTDGAESVIAGNSGWLSDLYPIFNKRVAAYLIGKDARRLESLLEELLRLRLTYKMQGLALWVSVAAAEMAVLDLLGRVAGMSIGELFGGVQRRDVAVYRASGRRGNTPEAEVEYLRQLVKETGASAVKFRVGGMLSKNKDSRPGRSETLIPMVREAFGDDMTIYADANSSYDAENAVRLGRLMHEHKYAFFEEPCRFDDLWETKSVADALELPIAGGEQEFSLRRFRWTILNRGLDVVQPDLHYFGGYIRSTKVALMANELGMECTPHMSGWGMGYLNALHFMSFIPNAAAHMEFKGYSKIPFECSTSTLKCEQGIIKVPSGPGFGIDIDPDYIQKSETV